MKTKKIKDHLYGKTIWLTFGTVEEIKRWYKKRGIDDQQQLSKFAEAFTCFIVREEGDYIVKDVHIHFTIYGFTRIVHETHHLTFKVLGNVGMSLTEETMEAYAYYQCWIAREIRDQFEKWTQTKS